MGKPLPVAETAISQVLRQHVVMLAIADVTIAFGPGIEFLLRVRPERRTVSSPQLRVARPMNFRYRSEK